MQTVKDKIERVVKPLKGNFLKLTRKNPETKKEEELELLTVVDQDGDTVATFSKKDHGPRFWFKATQYASNNSTLEQRLSVKELE